MKSAADAVIIGGGIIGAACAYYLSESGLNVHLIEHHFPASGSSRACDGLVLMWDKEGPALALGLESLKLWNALNESLEDDFGFERSGSILLAENETQLAAGKEKAAALQSAGLEAEILTPSTLLDLEPDLAPDLAGGILFPEDLQVDPRRATLMLLSAARRRGLSLHIGEEVVGIHRAGSTNSVITPQNEIAAPVVICAAGVWSNKIAQMVGLDLPIQPRKGHILVTEKAPDLIHHPLLEGGYVSTVENASKDEQVALVAEMTTSGTILLGSSREFAGYDRNVSLNTIRAIAARARRFLPELASINIIRSYAGLRPWSPDHLPLIGPVTSIPDFYLASGHEGAGIALAPITGRLIADWILGTVPPQLSEAILPDRFANLQEEAQNKER